MANDTKVTLAARNTNILSGIDKHLSSNKKLTIGGVDYTPNTLSAIYVNDSAAITAVATAKKAFEQSVASEREAHASTAEVTVALKNFILGFFGAKALTVLGDFGFSAPKSKGKKTVAVKAAAIEQSTATRAARHTMGPKQKKKVKGTVPSDSDAASTTQAATAAQSTAQTAGTTAPTKP